MSSFITANLYFSTLNRLWNLGEKQVFKQIYGIVYTKCTDLTEVNRHFDVYFCEDTSGLNRWNNCRFLSFFEDFFFKNSLKKLQIKLNITLEKPRAKSKKLLILSQKLLIFYKKFRSEHTIYGIAKFCHTQLYKLKIENGKWKIVNPVDKFI